MPACQVLLSPDDRDVDAGVVAFNALLFFQLYEMVVALICSRALG
jgi:hypothetical protein